MFGEPIPSAPDLSAAETEELEAYRAAARRYIDEVAEYRAELDDYVRAQFKEQQKKIDRRYNPVIAKAREEVRAYRIDAIARLERFLERHPNNDRYVPGVLYRLAVLHYEKADDDYYSADPPTLTTDHPDFSQSTYYSQELIRRYREFPQLDGTLYLLGFCQTQMEMHEEAKDTYLAPVEKFPESP